MSEKVVTREEILAMEPGRELDALVADKVIGLIIWSKEHLNNPYSTDISATWEVVEKVMEKEKAHVSIELFHDSRIDGRVSIHDREDKEDIILPYGKDQKAGFPKTLPEAISKASLLAVMDA